MKEIDTIEYYEKFLSPSDRAFATNDLAKLGEQAIDILEALFNGKAKNKFGVPYNQTGALGCGYVTARMLGEKAKPLELYIREGIKLDHPYAIEAVAALKDLDEKTALALAEAVLRNPFSVAPYSLVCCNAHRNLKVIGLLQGNPKVSYMLEKADRYLKDKA